MSSTGADNQFPPIAFQQSGISSSLNSTILLAFLMGIYTMVFFATLYMYVTRKGQYRRIIVAVITMQYILATLQLSLQWYLTQWQFVNNGETRETIFLSLNNFPAWIQISINFCGATMTILADGLLIWRCFYAWDCSFRVISVPLFLLIAEILLFLSSIIVPLANKLQLSAQEAIAINDIQAAAYVVSATTSMLATLLIAYRIYSVFKQNAIFTSRRRFGQVIDILVQSAAIYAIMMLIQATSLFLPNLGTSPSVFALDNYAVVLMFPIAGIAPSVMVARVCSPAAQEPTARSAAHTLTGLQFRVRSTDYSDTQIETDNIIVINRNDILPVHMDHHAEK